MLGRPGHAPYRDAGWVFPVIPDIDEAGEVRGEKNPVHARLRRQFLGFPAVERHAVQVTLERARSPADEIELPALLVQSHGRLRRPVAGGELTDQLADGRI